MKIAAILAVWGAAVFSGFSADPGMKALQGHVPAVISKLKAIGELPADDEMSLAIGLPLRNKETLTNLLQEIYNPASPYYHHYLTTEEFTEKFGPTEEDVKKVIDFAQANGFKVTHVHANRMLLDVTGKAGDVENAFHITLHTFHHPTENRVFFAPDAEPEVPSTLPVLDVSGLNNYGNSRPKLNFIPESRMAAHTNNPAKIGSGLFGSFLGNDFRNAYIPGSTLDGSGQAVGLFEQDGYYATDIAQYETQAGRASVTLQNVLVDGVSGVPGYSGVPGGNVEVALDIEMVIAMAPALSKVIVYEGPLFKQNDILNRMATDNLAKQLSSSWGFLGGPSATTDQIFQQMALQGQTFFDASGDSDAFTAGANSANGVDNPNIFNAPSDSPYITQVGGTELTMNGVGASYGSETVWNWGDFGGYGIGSSGGISSYYSIPTWQTNINFVASQGSSSFRNTPDVAAVADNIFVIANGGQQGFVAGTSAAAPLWAGFTALINQQAANQGHAAIGFLNPAIYALAVSPNYTNYFHDTTIGDNKWSASPNLFSATNGYDLCTGLGSPNGTNLIAALLNISTSNSFTHITPPLPPYGTTLSALNAGNPNGNWNLFVYDDQNLNSGMISNGWIISLTMANPVGGAGDNALTMSAAASTVVFGSNIVYSLTVTNYGPTISTNVIVSDFLPSGANYVSGTPTSGSVNGGSSLITWNIGTLATNTGARLTLTLQPTASGDFYNTAIVSAGTLDINPDDDNSTVLVHVVAPNPPTFSSILGQTNGMFQLTITSPALPTIIQASTNLINWVNIYTNIPPFTFTDSNAANYPIRFYRAVTP